MSGFGEAHDVYVVFGHVAMDFVTFPLGVDALYVEGADAVGVLCSMVVRVVVGSGSCMVGLVGSGS